MPKPFELTIKIKGHDDLVVQGEFSDKEHMILDRFLEQCDKLRQSKPLRESFPCEFSLKGGEGLDLTVEVSLPDNDTLSILLHRLRPFILQREPASYVTVSSILGKRLTDPYTRQLLCEQRKLYDSRDAQEQMRIKINGVVINSEKVLSDWLNSHEYHRDRDKREAVDMLFAGMPDLARALMISILVDKVKAILNLGALVALILGRTETLQFQIPGENKLNE